MLGASSASRAYCALTVDWARLYERHAGELALLVGNPSAVPDRIEIWSPSGGGRSIAQVKGAGFGRPFLRADGSAVIVQTSQTEATLVDLATGTPSAFPLHAPEAQFETNRIRVSIRLSS
jgi:hypothetical protein